MAARSTIERLPKELADICNRLIREGKTIHEITDKLNELAADVSKSAVGRYVKSAREKMATHLSAQAVAGQWVQQLGENAKGDVGTLLAEMLKTIAFQTLANMGDEEQLQAGIKPPKPMDIMLLAKAIRDLEATSKANIERREKIERAAIERAAKKVGEVASHAGISAENIALIQQELRLL